MKTKLFWLPAVALMIIIFYFSSQPAEVSGNLSGGIAYQIVRLAADVTGQEWKEEELLLLAEKLDYPIRKMAHLTEYALLGMAVALGGVHGSSWSNYSIKKQYFLVQIIGSLYAAGDEIHQLFVPGRAGLVGDVLIDSLGILIGWLVFYLFATVFGLY